MCNETSRKLTPHITFPPELPITAHADAIEQSLRYHQVIIVCGDTGSGKTTQLPKIALKAGRGSRGIIGCTQPRRLAALAMEQLFLHSPYRGEFNARQMGRERLAISTNAGKSSS